MLNFQLCNFLWVKKMLSVNNYLLTPDEPHICICLFPLLCVLTKLNCLHMKHFKPLEIQFPPLNHSKAYAQFIMKILHNKICWSVCVSQSGAVSSSWGYEKERQIWSKTDINAGWEMLVVRIIQQIVNFQARVKSFRKTNIFMYIRYPSRKVLVWRMISITVDAHLCIIMLFSTRTRYPSYPL